MTESLSPFDRATLWLWRATNLIGWSGLAVQVAYTLHQLMIQIVGSMQTSFFHDPTFTRDVLTMRVMLQELLWRVVVSAAGGSFIGRLVGDKVWIRPRAVAVVAALAYVTLAFVTLEMSTSWTEFPPGRRAANPPWLAVPLAGATASAVLWAWWAAGRRHPAAPSVAMAHH